MMKMRIKGTKVKRSKSEIITLSILFVIIGLHALSLLYPLFWAVLNALKTNKMFEISSTSFPDPIVWQNFKDVFEKVQFNGVSMFSMLGNTLWICISTTVISAIANLMVAYPIARFRFPGRDFLYAMVIFSMTIPIIGTGSTGYRLQYNLGLIDNPPLMALTWLNGFGGNFLILYGAVKTISQTYAEAAYIDGANEIHVLTRIIMPQVLPSLVAIGTLNFIGFWSNYHVSLITFPSYPNLALGIFLFTDMVAASKTVYFAAVCVSMLPILVLYACCQKTIMNNFTVGGIKG